MSWGVFFCFVYELAKIGEVVALEFGTHSSRAPLLSVLKNLIIILVSAQFYLYIRKTC